MANIIVGILDVDELIFKKKFLLNTMVLDTLNYTTMARLFDNSIMILGGDFNINTKLLFISDAASYLVKAASVIQTFYPKIAKFSCLAHGFNLVCEQIQSLYPKVDRLMANIKKVFLKAVSRIDILKILEPGLHSPQPIITR